MKYIYLAGLISTDKPETILWRRWVRNKIFQDSWNEGKDVTVLDPMRGRDDLARRSPDKGITDPRFTSKDIMIRDYLDVKKADVILVNLNDYGSERPLVGTLFELGWAWQDRKPVVAVVDEENTLMRNHPFVKETVTHYFTEMKEACQFIMEQLV